MSGASSSSSAPSPDRIAQQRVLCSTSSQRSTRVTAGTSSTRARHIRGSTSRRTPASRTRSLRRVGCGTSSASRGRSSSTTSKAPCITPTACCRTCRGCSIAAGRSSTRRCGRPRLGSTTSSSGGTCCLHLSTAYLHRGLNAHPEGRLARLGGDPPMGSMVLSEKRKKI